MPLWRRALWLVLGGLVFFLGAGVVVSWAPDRSVDELSARWAPAPSTFLALQGMRVHLRDEGPRDDPMPIVLLHGTSDSLHTWDGWTRELSRQRRVIRFDLPGFGLTGPEPADNYSIARYVRFVRAMLDALGVRACVLGGNSLGGQIAWEVALAAPDQVRRLVLVDAGGYDFRPEDVPIGFRLARLTLVRRAFEYLLPRGLIQASVRNVYGDPSRVVPELVDRYYDMALRAGNRRALGFRLDAALASDVSRLRFLAAPTLVIWGGRDRLIPPVWGRRFAQDIPGAELVVFDALGHVPQEEDPAQTVQVVRRFLGLGGGG